MAMGEGTVLNVFVIVNEKKMAKFLNITKKEIVLAFRLL